MRVWCFVCTNCVPSSSLVLAHCFFCFFHMNKNVVGSLCLEMSLVYAYAINAFHVALSAYQFCVCMFCMVTLWNCLEAKPCYNESLALPFEIIFGMSQSLTSITQPTRINHIWRIIIRHSTLWPTTCWFIRDIWYMKTTNPNLSK